MPSAFIRKFQNFNFHQKLYQKGDGIVLGISGGPDSTVMALIFSKISKKYDLNLLFVHINYHLRGKKSDEDEKFVMNLSKKIGIPLKIHHYPKNTKQKGNLEENLRNFRYEIFEKERVKNNFDMIAVAHTLDDNVETFFMNLLRGAGSEGLSTMKSKNGKIIRPLLFAEKKEILHFLKKSGEKYCMDESNLDFSFKRNRIRGELIPYLEEKFNPKIKNAIASLIENIQSEKELWGEILEKRYLALRKKEKGRIFFEKEAIKNLGDAWLKFFFRQAIMDLLGNLRNIEMAHYFEFKKTFLSDKSKDKKIKTSKFQIRFTTKFVFFEKTENNIVKK